MFKIDFGWKSIIGILLVCSLLASGCSRKQAESPGENIVATYSGKSLTKQELIDYIRRQGVKEQEHAICEEHGFDHSQCDKLEPCESHPLHSIEAYRTMIKTLVLEQMMEDWAKEKGITRRKEVKHGLKHLVEEINLGSLVAKMHEDELTPDKIEMQQYYEEHREEYKGRSFSGVEREIKNILAAEKGKKFIPKYIEKLKENAVISRNYDLLKVEEPTEAELRDYYESHNDEYKVIEGQNKRQKQFEEVIGEVRAKLIQEKEDEKYRLNKFEALFTMHGRRFTLGEFKEEFSELSPEQKRQFASFQAKKNLVDQLIIKELLLEDVGDRMLDRENKKEVEDLKAEIIRQILHTEEVDERIEISDEEAKKIYDKRKNLFVEPAKAKISYIRVGQGISGDEEKRDRQKIEEAYQKIQSGVDFASVAKDYSEDWTATSGGELDQWIYEGGSHLGEVIEHGFHKVIFKLKPGEVSKVFEFGGDFFIVKMRQKQERRQQAFEEAKPDIKELLSVHKHQERALELQDELLEKSKLIIYDYVLRQMLREEKERQREVKEETER